MNRIRPTYDRISVGARIKARRRNLGLSQEALAEQMDRDTKYCSDIERGYCGMSVETMLLFSKHLKMSLDYMMFGLDKAQDYLDSIPEDELRQRALELEASYALNINKYFDDMRRKRKKKKTDS